MNMLVEKQHVQVTVVVDICNHVRFVKNAQVSFCVIKADYGTVPWRAIAIL